ncbi:hypothetical protein [Campylobacter rectus]|uniref:hypothetical protein n=1 Tax=Campylobacter rectus TaxID=203 RepID=UPI0040629671
MKYPLNFTPLGLETGHLLKRPPALERVKFYSVEGMDETHIGQVFRDYRYSSVVFYSSACGYFVSYICRIYGFKFVS